VSQITNYNVGREGVGRGDHGNEVGGRCVKYNIYEGSDGEMRY
jgi:hypothetical protein